MKTQLFGIAAIVLAFAGSAFTSAKPADNNAKRTNYYWYYNDPVSHTYTAQGLSSTPPAGISCPSVVTIPQNCLKGFTSDPGAANAATTTAQQNIPRQLVP